MLPTDPISSRNLVSSGKSVSSGGTANYAVFVSYSRRDDAGNG